ncbi:hypothetical protein, partial [Rhodoplanes sp. SY1]|uniref:hypothetical protein n=1 Tax=Rhodoplanes sp. SY1 TaxID=3166646 RepID=UPI0038B47B44
MSDREVTKPISTPPDPPVPTDVDSERLALPGQNAQIGQELSPRSANEAQGDHSVTNTVDTSSTVRQTGRRPETAPLVALLIALLIFYSAPIIVAFGFMLAGIGTPTSDIKRLFDEQAIGTKIIVKIAEDRNQYLGLFHQLLVPVLAAFTALGFEDFRRTCAASWLFVLPLVSLLLAIMLAVTFPFVTNSDKATMVADLFNTMAQNLSVYVLMLVGL